MECGINDLMDDVLLTIMLHLSLEDLCLGARLVCKRWHDLTHDRSLWRTLSLQNKADSLTDEHFLLILSQICDYVEDISLRGCTLLSDTAFKHEDIKCPNLRCFDVSNTMITDSGLCSSMSKYRHLRKLSCLRCENLTQSYKAFQKCDSLKEFMDPYEDCENAPEDANEELVSIFQKNSQLEMVRIAQKLLEDDVIVALAKYCPNVHTLHLPNCIWVSGEAFISCVIGLPKLKSLDISGTTICDSDLVEVSPRLPHLEELNVSACRRITDIGIISMASQCPFLKCLILNDSRKSNADSGNVSDVGLRTIGENCCRLEELTMFLCPSVSDVGLQRLAEGCPRLTHLDISGCLSLTDRALKRVADCCGQLKKLVASECVQFTSRSINYLLQRCTRLQSLELETCHYIGTFRFGLGPDCPCPAETPENEGDDEEEESPPNLDTASSTLTHSPASSTYPTRSSLRVLDLSFCSKITNDSVKQISHHCGLLRYLSLRGCSIGDQAVEAVAMHCIRLQVLDISGGSFLHTSKLTDKALETLGAHCKSLVMLSITRIHKIKMAGLITLIKDCKTLQRINLTASRELNHAQIIQNTRELRGKCLLQTSSFELVKGETRGHFFMKFPPLSFPSYY